MAFLDKNGLSRLWAYIIEHLGEKVDKEDGKGLSTNDYSDEDKAQLIAVSDGLSETSGSLNKHLSMNHVNTYNGQTGDIVVPQPDFLQNDETAADFIKNKPIEMTEEDALNLLSELSVVEPVTNEDGAVFTDENGAIFVL